MNNIIAKQKVELAINTHKLLKFDYVSKDLAVSRDRVAQPFEITHNKYSEPDGVKTMDMIKNEPRIFQFEGMFELELIDFSEVYTFKKIDEKIKESIDKPSK